jgi:hypothetical protein
MSTTQIDFAVTRELVRKILENATAFEWTLQGFGMFRLYLGKVGRIHLWDRRFAVPEVSNVHTHPWDLRSTVISGRLTNLRFGHVGDEGIRNYYGQKLQTGEGGGLKGEPFQAALYTRAREHFGPGDVYQQMASEIHESQPEDGTVTIMERPKGPDFTEHAFVYWDIDRGPIGWVSAEPRRATHEQVFRASVLALDVLRQDAA